MTDVRSIAANTVVENVLSGKIHEFLPRRCLVRFLGVAAAVGVRATLLIGNESFVQDQEIAAKAGFPLFPDDVVVEGMGFPNDRLVLTVRNTTGAAIISQVAVDVIPR